VFFGVELILREFSVEALFPVMLSAMVADVVGDSVLGGGRFLSGFPAGLALHHARDYLLIAALAVIAALVGLGFKTVLYRTEDLCDRIWKDRPEWARPAVGGLALGLLLLALPQMYGAGYPVMYKAVAGGYLLWFLIVLAAGKMIAASLTIGIGGSGGVFAPSLFIGATSGAAFGEIADHLLGPGAGPPALYAAVAMAAVFASAARAPLTSLASVVEMTGDFALTLPVMLAVAIALSRALSYSTIYTAKLLRSGTDIDRAPPWQALDGLTVSDAMHPFAIPLAVAPDAGNSGSAPPDSGGQPGLDVDLPGPVTCRREPQALFAGESLVQPLRQLMAYDVDGLPVLSADGRHVQGWVTDASIIAAVARRIHGSQNDALQTALAADRARPDPDTMRKPPTPLAGYHVAEITVEPRSAAAGTALGSLTWPPGSLPVSVRRHNRPRSPDPGLTLRPGDRIVLLIRRRDAPYAAGGTLLGRATVPLPNSEGGSS
jgi:chloride channel protein, CIC family